VLRRKCGNATVTRRERGREGGRERGREGGRERAGAYLIGGTECPGADDGLDVKGIRGGIGEGGGGSQNFNSAAVDDVALLGEKGRGGREGREGGGEGGGVGLAFFHRGFREEGGGRDGRRCGKEGRPEDSERREPSRGHENSSRGCGPYRCCRGRSTA